jgi:hypothetical protein
MIKPEGYKILTKLEKLKICNGTGAKGTPKIIIKFFDNFFGIGIDLSKASNIHDYCYYEWNGWKMKITADIIYLLNMIILCFKIIFKKPLSNIIGSFILFPIRVIRALIYFLSVLFFGWKAFKNK